MYQLLADANEVCERRAQWRLLVYAAPELLAIGPNQLWSWDITRRKGPTTLSALLLYVELDVFSMSSGGCPRRANRYSWPSG